MSEQKLKEQINSLKNAPDIASFKKTFNDLKDNPFLKNIAESDSLLARTKAQLENSSLTGAKKVIASYTNLINQANNKPPSGSPDNAFYTAAVTLNQYGYKPGLTSEEMEARQARFDNAFDKLATKQRWAEDDKSMAIREMAEEYWMGRGDRNGAALLKLLDGKDVDGALAVFLKKGAGEDVVSEAANAMTGARQRDKNFWAKEVFARIMKANGVEIPVSDYERFTSQANGKANASEWTAALDLYQKARSATDVEGEKGAACASIAQCYYQLKNYPEAQTYADMADRHGYEDGNFTTLKGLIKDNLEIPGTADAYNDLDKFKLDWRVVAAAKIVGSGINYDDFEDIATGKYVVEKAVAAAKAAVDATEKKEDPAKTAACDKIAVIAGTIQVQADNSVKLIGGIGNDAALEIAVQSGVLYRGDSRADVKRIASKSKDDVSQEVFGFEGKNYALTHAYAKDKKIAPNNVKKEGKKIVEAPLGCPDVKEVLRKSIQESLFILGVVDAKGERSVTFKADATNKAIDDYIGKKVDLTPQVRLQLATIASVSRDVPAGKEIGTAEALVVSEPAVRAAIEAKCAGAADRNAAALEIVAHLNSSGDIKDNKGNFLEKKALDLIGQYTLGGVAKKTTLPPAQEKTEGKQTGETPVVKLKTALDEYKALDESGKKLKIIGFAADNAEVDAALSKNRTLNSQQQDSRIAHIASQPAETIFKDDKTGMDASKIVALLEKYDADNAPGSQSGGMVSTSVDGQTYSYTKGSATNPAIAGLLDTSEKLKAVVSAMKTQAEPIEANNVQQAIQEFVAYANDPLQDTAFSKSSVPDANSLAFQITVKWNRDHAKN